MPQLPPRMASRLRVAGASIAGSASGNPVHPALKDAGPYIAVLVELPDADNVRMIGNLLGDPKRSPPSMPRSKRSSKITTKDSRWYSGSWSDRAW